MSDRDPDPIPLDTANNDGRSAGDGPAMARHDHERITMNDEQAAFLAGYRFGAEATIQAHDALIGAVTLLAGCLHFGAVNLDVRDSQGEPRYLDEDDVLAVADGRMGRCMADVRRVREQGAVSLALFELEQAMAVQR